MVGTPDADVQIGFRGVISARIRAIGHHAPPWDRHRSAMLLFDTQVSPATLLLLALSLDGVLGEPRWLWGRIGHPVAWLGRLIGWCDRTFNREADLVQRRLAAGAVVAIAVIGATASLGALVAWAAAAIPGGWLVELALVAILLAFRSLHDHVSAVADGLDHSLDAGRGAVAHIVGRDPDTLDAHGVARAAIESTAENFVDGILAPALWYLAFGLPGLFAYKAVNTLDSQIGHRTPRHQAFGRVAARIDDAANWLPARAAAVLLAVAALPAVGRAKTALASALRDAGQHRSVNAGWPEAAMAGALGLRLAGPRWYGGTLVPDAWMGQGRAEAGSSDIRAALSVMTTATLVLAAVSLALALAVHL